MGRQSKATKAWLSNLRRLNNPQNPSVEDASDNEDLDFEDDDLLKHGFFFLDDESPSEEDSDASDSDKIQMPLTVTRMRNWMKTSLMDS